MTNDIKFYINVKDRDGVANQGWYCPSNWTEGTKEFFEAKFFDTHQEVREAVETSDLLRRRKITVGQISEKELFRCKLYNEVPQQ